MFSFLFREIFRELNRRGINPVPREARSRETLALSFTGPDVLRTMSAKKIQVTFDVDRECWFKFKALAHSHDLSINRALEGVLRETLRSVGIDVRPANSAPVKAEGPEPMVGSR